jgi:hypothetical protein
MRRIGNREISAEDSPSNVEEGDIIKALDDLLLHLVDGCRAPCHPETELCCSPILFDKIELAMILGVEIAQMTARLNQLLKLGLLRHEVRLREKNAPAAAVIVLRGAAKTRALGKKVSSLGPQTTLPNNDLHALEPAGHGGVVFREIKRLMLAVWEFAAAHAWAIRVVCPPFLRSCKRG